MNDKLAMTMSRTSSASNKPRHVNHSAFWAAKEDAPWLDICPLMSCPNPFANV